MKMSYKPGPLKIGNAMTTMIVLSDGPAPPVKEDQHFAQALGNGASAKTLLALLRDIDASMRRAWKDGSLSADAWPTDLAQRVAQAVG